MDALELKHSWWNAKWMIPGTSWHICGYSRSAFRTGFYVPQLNMMLDAGPQNFNKPDHILVTHTHMDHIACLPMTMIGDVHGDHQFHIYGPAEAQHHVENYIQAMFCVNAVSLDVPVREWFTYHALTARDTFGMEAKGVKLDIEVFECCHRIPTVSYGLSEIKNKLCAQYAGLSGPEIVALRKAGTCVTQPVKQRKLAYVCDTSIDVFALNPSLLQYPVVFIECTFLCPDDPERVGKDGDKVPETQRATDTGHIHWQQLKPYVLANPDTLFVLFHFSQRYNDLEILDFFHKACAAQAEDVANEVSPATVSRQPIKNIRCWVYGTAMDPSAQFIHVDIK